ncbi:MAG TPA: DUF1223 domain-containing protein [Methyloceanibacter sp.]|jgi:hypothetical protein|nr:DUF1223 domain-containing protein [Methyloceanibacter sp.]
MRPCFFSAGALAALAALAVSPPGLADPPKQAASPAVVELFTSQGCSACPPADALLADLGKRPGLLALSYSVDYWNYLGWHDTLSSPANSERQREYARMRGDGAVYTPQVVVDGVMHVNGSNEAAIEMAMRNAGEQLRAVKVPISMDAEGDTLVIGIGAADDKSDKRDGTVWLVAAKDKETVSITRGENRGKTLSYHHPVREVSPVGMWKGEAMTLRLPLKDLKIKGGDYLVALLQVENGGPILGAAQFDPR